MLNAEPWPAEEFEWGYSVIVLGMVDFDTAHSGAFSAMWLAAAVGMGLNTASAAAQRSGRLLQVATSLPSIELKT